MSINNDGTPHIMDTNMLLAYWNEFLQEKRDYEAEQRPGGIHEGWEDFVCDEYQFAMFLKEKSDYS